MDEKLQVNIGRGLLLKNPVMTASGTFGYGSEYNEFVDLNHLGGIIVKGLSLKPSKGNPPPRIVETPSGMLNAIGLENVGIDAFISEKLPFLKQFQTPVITNIYGRDMDEYAALALRVEETEGIAGVEVNISCPNVKLGGIAFGADPDSAHRVVQAVRNQTTKHVMVKLSPNVTDIVEIASGVEDAGADSLSLINTLTGMAVDIDTCCPKLANITGGLSGPAIKPIAVYMVYHTAKALDIPIVGCGGIISANDALEFIMAGASAVQVGTANLTNPQATLDVLEGIEQFMKQEGIQDISEIIGAAH